MGLIRKVITANVQDHPEYPRINIESSLSGNYTEMINLWLDELVKYYDICENEGLFATCDEIIKEYRYIKKYEHNFDFAGYDEIFIGKMTDH